MEKKKQKRFKQEDDSDVENESNGSFDCENLKSNQEI